MIRPARPEHEDRRVEALRALKVLDTPNEERYDRIVRKLAELFDVPIAYLALIDANRQWLKSEIGGMPCETDRDLSFCAHAILDSRPLIIPDARRDPRFADNPMVTGEPHIRFYAGVPLTSSEGHGIGTLCIADQRPRQFDPADLEVLVAFAARVAAKLNAKPKVFISYSHRDEEWKDRLVSHLSVLQVHDLLHLWDDRRIGAGDAWQAEIQEAMESSNVAILLVSANYLTSDFILDVEVPRLLSRRDGEGLQIVPVVVKPCAWNQVGWLQRMNLYPRDGRPLSGVNDHEVDSLLADFASIVLDKSRQAPQALPSRSRPQPVDPAPERRPEALAADGDGSEVEDRDAQQPQPAAPGVRLALSRKGDAEAPPEWFAFRQQRVQIGRNPACDLRLADDQRVISCRHAEVVARADGHYLTDLGSKNFTFLNGERLEPERPYRLEPGDTIGIYDFEIRFEVIDDPPPLAEQETVFERGYVNPFTRDALLLANVLLSVAELYDREATSRRDDALEEALGDALGAETGHTAHEVVGRLLSRRRDDRGARLAPVPPAVHPAPAPALAAAS